MKLQRLFVLGCMVASMALVTSCSDGEDGAPGKNGIDGKDGTNGTNGVDGVDGADGADGINCWDLNGDGIANMTGEYTEDVNGDQVVDALDCQGADGQGTTAGRIIVDVSAVVEGTNPVTLDSATYPELAALTQEVLATHAVLVYLSNGSTYISIPGRIEFLNLQYDVTFATGAVLITMSDYDGVGAGPGWSDTLTEVHIVLIPTTDLAGKSQADVMASLKGLGVDANDYHEVMRYFEID
ncbi:MAG: hypothetical protein RIM83_18980 [Allomuricauda sp.]